ncbi:hypothetical protein [Chamaesiphon sp. OTE_20_metabat_361]|uniref:hypothetical protein n=1 Tax=Chamaesiphon sp. OTE_20_metabat_361 TaxID=2964689 RepID=UPI00286A4B5A|nr:hypothetical protein [Chamaesiphon sp. OTE_20_metabat_361]
MKDWIDREIASLIDRYGQVPPLWVIFPDEHPYSMCWRMGYGDSYPEIWNQWWHDRHFSEAERIAYFQQWTLPAMWLKWTILAIWNLRDSEDDADVDLTPYFDRLAALGFPIKEDYERDFHDPKWCGDEEDLDLA